MNPVPTEVELQTYRMTLSAAHAYLQLGKLGMLREARRELKKIGGDFRSTAAVLSLRGQVLLANARWGAAAKNGHKAASLYPEVPDFYIQEALAYENLGQHEKARKTWLSAPAPLRCTPQYHLNLARCEARLGHLELARQHVKIALHLSPDWRDFLEKDPAFSLLLQDPSLN